MLLADHSGAAAAIIHGGSTRQASTQYAGQPGTVRLKVDCPTHFISLSVCAYMCVCVCLSRFSAYIILVEYGTYFVETL